MQINSMEGACIVSDCSSVKTSSRVHVQTVCESVLDPHQREYVPSARMSLLKIASINHLRVKVTAVVTKKC